MRDEKLRLRFGKAGRLRAEEKFSWRAIAKETRTLYQSLVRDGIGQAQTRAPDPRGHLKVAVKATEVTGLAAGCEYLRFFFNPVGTICRLYRRYGPVTALGRVKFQQPRDLLVFAIGPEFNRLLFSDPSLFRPTGLILPGPRKSAQRRVRFGLTRMIGDQHRQQRQLVAPPFHRCAVQGLSRHHNRCGGYRDCKMENRDRH